MKINLAYGTTGHLIELPDNLNIDIIEPLWVENVIDPGFSGGIKSLIPGMASLETIKYNHFIPL